MSAVKRHYARTSLARIGTPVEEAFNHICHLMLEKSPNTLMGEGIINTPPLRPDNGNYSTSMAVL
ncbi:MAG: hypothetical protein ACTSXJ_10745 [Candidatus Baldrarchaeia archaeon]